VSFPSKHSCRLRTQSKIDRHAVIGVIYHDRRMRLIIGLGGNIGDPAAAFARALDALGDQAWILFTSRLWITRAVGPEQPDYLNAAAVIHWPGDLHALLARCRELEEAAGRDRTTEKRWGPRVLDLDLLLADGIVCRGPGLEVPHPRFHERRFALEPAAEVAPEWVHPLLGLTVSELAEAARPAVDDGAVRALEPEGS
jgi:2-amino-4-hydroxy-6-hydroxymethyldihydropteridine diphosphokinase